MIIRCPNDSWSPRDHTAAWTCYWSHKCNTWADHCKWFLSDKLRTHRNYLRETHTLKFNWIILKLPEFTKTRVGSHPTSAGNVWLLSKDDPSQRFFWSKQIFFLYLKFHLSSDSSFVQPVKTPTLHPLHTLVPPTLHPVPHQSLWIQTLVSLLFLCCMFPWTDCQFSEKSNKNLPPLGNSNCHLIPT